MDTTEIMQPRVVNKMGQGYVERETGDGCEGSHVLRKQAKSYVLYTNVLSWYTAEFFQCQTSLAMYANSTWGC